MIKILKKYIVNKFKFTEISSELRKTLLIKERA